MNMEYIRADQLPFDPRPQMSMIFADGFYMWLRFFSKDKAKLARAFAHIFDLSHFYVAIQDGEVAALVSSTAGNISQIKLDKKTLYRELGCIRGHIAYAALTKNLVNHVYPFELPPQTGTIEFVATAPAFRGKGVAQGLIAHVMENMPYAEYMLEVADNNDTALRLYEKLGFIAFMRTSAPIGSGFKHYVYMKCRSKSVVLTNESEDCI